MKKSLIWTGIIIVAIVGFLVVYIFNFISYSEEISTGKPIPEYKTVNKALIVIDIQEGTTGTVGDKAYQNGSEVYIETVNNIIWKTGSLGIPVIYIRSEIDDPVINLFDGRYSPGSEGSRLDSRLSILSDHIFTKDRGDSFCNPKLDSTLNSMEVSHLLITGLDAAKCVNRTISGALNRGYSIEVIVPGITADSEESLNTMLKEFESKGVTLSKGITP